MVGNKADTGLYALADCSYIVRLLCARHTIGKLSWVHTAQHLVCTYTAHAHLAEREGLDRFTVKGREFESNITSREQLALCPMCLNYTHRIRNSCEVARQILTALFKSIGFEVFCRSMYPKPYFTCDNGCRWARFTYNNV